MISFYFTEAFRLIRKSGYNSVVLIFVTTLAVFVTVASLGIVFGVQSLDDTVKSGIKLNVFLKPDLQQLKIDSIKIEIEKLNSVKSANYISSEIAENIFLKETGEDFKKVLDNNPLPSSYKVSLVNNLISEKALEHITSSIKEIDGVEEVIFDHETTLKLLKSLRMIQYFFYPLSILLMILSIYLVYSNNKLLIRRNLSMYNTMRLVGCTSTSIRIPVILSGIIIGLITSVICLILYNVFYTLLIATLNNIKFDKYYFLINLLIVVISISLAFVGSYLSSRLINKK